ncbi:MAG: FeoA family protein [Phycisphaerae bacterium]|jgi:ferrous iron transport protein A
MSKLNGSKKPVYSMGKQISLALMRAGQKGNILQISGGHGIADKLEALGIREGQEIKKISEQWMKGPILLQHGNTQLALGFGLASKVLVEITGEY